MARRERWELVEAQRRALAARVGQLPAEQWDHPSRCEGWQVRDVLGHLVHMAESTARSMTRDLRRRAGRDRDRGFSLAAQELGARPVPELCDRLVAAAGSRYSGMPSVALSEVVVHGDDMLRPLGQSTEVSPEAARAVLRQLYRVDRLAARWAFHGPPHRGVRLVATDVAWSAGSGPEVEGRALDLAGLLAHRPDVVESLSGAGVSRLPEKAGAI
jgi:uncharacterized protein (TIGR03083 family)